MRLLLLTIFIVSSLTSQASDKAYLRNLSVKPSAGDGSSKLLARYHLLNTCNLEEFYRLNNLRKGEDLLLHHSYTLPIKIYRYDHKSIRSTIGDSDRPKAERIQAYNERLYTAGLRQSDYRSSGLLWVPHHELGCAKTAAVPTLRDPLLGDNQLLSMNDQSLAGKVFYLVAGHGGPDPGALGNSHGNTLCEDEYAYDVVLRLYKMIREHGGEAELVIQDKNDGIRSSSLLDCDTDETCGGQPLPLNQLKRLRQRVEHINKKFKAHRQKGVKDQVCVSIHVDSRSQRHRQDVFFCHYGLSSGSRQLAQNLQKTFTQKYKKHRKSGQYSGTIEERNLFILKNTMPRAVLVELANIRNANDHQRLLKASNRQALAKWIFEGLVMD
ncbi:MAG: N-acetylmuramoyl-L-alanine amidase [Saprospiraceae bacterium]|nr:N-acetylmuramoyl-L-alanine amidase [Saprospiraceae bacterium]